MSRLFRTISAAAAAGLLLFLTFPARAEVLSARLGYIARTGAFPAAGGWGTVAVNATSETNWSLAGAPAWIKVGSGSPWTGSGVATFYVYPNTGAQRSTTLSVGGSSFTILQAAGTCEATISPTSAFYQASGARDRSITVRGGLCQWGVTSTASWLSTISIGGTGSGNIFYKVDAADQRRSAALIIGSQVHIVDQDGPACGYYTPSPEWYDIPSAGGQGSFDLFLNSNCPAWSVSSDSSWVIVHNSSGSGSGTVQYTVEANPNDYAREAVLIVNGNPHFIRQRPSETPGYVILQPGSEGFDTAWGTAFYQAGRPDDATIYYGGSGDVFSDYFYFDVGPGLKSASVARAELLLFVTARAPNDPHLQLWHLTEPWAEAGVSSTSHPAGVVIRNLPPFQTGWNRIDITDLYKRWRNGTYSNFGVKLAPAGTPSNARGSLATSDHADADKRPQIVLTYREEPLHTSIGVQRMLQVVGGTGHQEVYCNYSTGVTVTSPYSWTSGGVPYEAPAGDWVGMYLYDYASGRFTQAVYGGR